MLLGLSAPDLSPFTVHYHHPSDPFEHRSHVPFSFLGFADKETSWNDGKYFCGKETSVWFKHDGTVKTTNL